MAAAPLISPLAAWVAALVTGASGVSRVVPAGVLHSDRFGAEDGSPDSPEITEDRRVEVRYVSGDLRPFAGDCRRGLLSFEVRIAYRYDLELADVDTAPGVSRTTIARLRCADDAAVIREALLDARNYGAASNGAVVVQIEPGVHTIDDPGAGVLLGVLPLVMTASYDPSSLAMGTALTGDA